jgi:HTH-type transcriptional regulator, sugar sensing transcriptional regulator
LKQKVAPEELQRLGLTSYEAKCYVSLVGLGPSDVRKVAGDAEIPYPNTYGALASLEKRGWAETVRNRPKTYRARKPHIVKEMVQSELEETFDVLDRLYSEQPAEEAELVYTVRGRERVLSKIYELLEGAKKSVVLVSPTMGLEDGRMLELLAEAVKRGAKVRAVGDDGATGLLPPGVEIRTANLVAVDMLIDDEMALIALPDYSACGWIDSPQVAEHFKQFLELLWSTSSRA